MKDNDPIESAVTDALNGAPLAAPSETLGQILKNAREKMGLSIGDAAVKLHLRPKIVEDLEADVFTNIASATYARGYVKNFARLVGADPALVEACLAKQVPLVTEPAMQSFSRKTTHQATDTKLKWLSLMIVLILLGLFVVWWMQKSSLLTHVDVSQPTVEEVAAANQSLSAEALLTETDASQRLSDIAVNGSMATDGPVRDSDESSINLSEVDGSSATVTAPSSGAADNTQAVDPAGLNANTATANAANAAPTQGAAMANQPSSANPAASSQPVTTPQPSTNSPANGSVYTTNPVNTNSPANTNNSNLASTQVATIPGQSSLNIQLSGDCWINILDAKGKVLVDGVSGAGANIQVSGVAPFKVILGAPHVVTHFSLDGQTVSLADFPKGRVARLTLPKA